jgi:hypothetical protein
MGNSPAGYAAWRRQARKAELAEKHVAELADTPVHGIVTAMLYIGADNLADVVDRVRLHTVLDERHDGYTSVGAVGVWRSVREDSVIVTISDTEDKIAGTIALLKDSLNQHAIGVLWLPAMVMA